MIFSLTIDIKYITGSSHDIDPVSSTVATGNVLVPGAESDDLSSSTDTFSDIETISSGLQVIKYSYGLYSLVC